MASIKRTATAVWEGGLSDGHGLVSASSGAFTNQAVTWASRVERSDGRTSPEELIAAAHAACFGMALSHVIGQAGATPRRLDITATCTLERNGGTRIAAMHLEVTGRVEGMSAAEFEAAAKEAKDSCPVSGALKHSVAIEVNASLAAASPAAG